MLKSKLTELEKKIPDVSSLATKTALTAVENKIPDVIRLVEQKTNYDTKISDLEKKITDHDHDKYITTSEINALATNVANTKITQTNLATKTNFDINVLSIDSKITATKSKSYNYKS